MNPDEPKGIFEIKENEIMPIYIYVADLNMFGHAVNFMAVISYIFKDNAIKTAARIRFDETGNKNMFPGTTTPYSEDELDKTRLGIKTMLIKAEQSLGIPLRTKKPSELKFEIGETTESILKKLKESDLFNITQKPL